MTLSKVRLATMALVGVLLLASSPVSARDLSRDYGTAHHTLANNASVTAGTQTHFVGRFRPLHARLADKSYPEHSSLDYS